MKVIITRGISGSGKSSYIKANYPEAVVCSADKYFVDEHGVFRFDRKKQQAAHNKCLRNFVKALANAEALVVVDNTATKIIDVVPYTRLALAYGYEIEVLRFKCSPKTAAQRNTHGVPTQTIYQQHRQFEQSLRRWSERVIDTEPVLTSNDFWDAWP